MNAALIPNEDRKTRSKYGWKFWWLHKMTTWDCEVVSWLLSRLQQKHEKWYVEVDELIWVEDAIDKVHELFWYEEANKISWLIRIAREQKMYSWFVQDLLDWINHDESYNQWVAFWILHSSIERILSDFRDEIDHNLKKAAKIDWLLPKSWD